MIFPKIFIKGKCLNNQNYKCLQFKYIRKERYCVLLEEKKNNIILDPKLEKIEQCLWGTFLVFGG